VASPRFRLIVERLPDRLRTRHCAPIRAEGFGGPRTMEDLRLYAMTRRLFKAVAKYRGPSAVVHELERPPGVDNQVGERTPQFFLRNVRRVERFLDERSLFKEVRTRDPAAERAVGNVLSGRYAPPELLTHWNLHEMLRFRKLIRRVLYEEPWSRRFGRELKEHVHGPLFRYDPDAPKEA